MASRADARATPGPCAGLLRVRPKRAGVPSLFLAGAAAVLAGTAGAACGGGERPPHTEDEARSTAPVPACVVALAPRPHAAGTVRNLQEDEIWKAVFPRYDAQAHSLPLDALACTGERVFDAPAFAGGRPRATAAGPDARSGAPVASAIDVEEGDVTVGNAGDRIRIAWLRTHRWPDGTEAGPIALVRANGDVAEVYAVGVYHGAAGHAGLEAERLGPELLVAAADDGCEGRPKSSPCASTTTLYLPRYGRLSRLAKLTTEERAYASGTEPGVMGQLEYELTSSPEYTPDGIRVLEQVQATDAAGRVLRKTELERKLVLREGALTGPTDSLWERVYPAAAEGASGGSRPRGTGGERPRAR